MSIIYRKRNGITYVYESEPYWDSSKKQPRSHQRLLGKLDPVTNEIVPTMSRQNFDYLLNENKRLKEENESLRVRLSKYEEDGGTGNDDLN